MNICSDGHEEICHEPMKCPICLEIVELTDKHKTDVDELNNRITELETEVAELKAELGS